jgi:membrane-associated protease RseP (regulator of RpoE activity)
MESARERRRSVALFVATLASMYVSQVLPWVLTEGFEALRDPQLSMDALAYTAALMSILLAHELAHYLVALRHGFRLSLPYFIPLPVGFGTLGAVIQLRSQPANRTALLEMGVAGPLAGAVVAFAMLAIGLQWTGPDIELQPGLTYTIFSDPWVVKLIGVAVAGAPPGRYAELHPVALAGWIGCLLTSINLIPLGQADGGHVMGALLPRWARRISWGVIGVMVLAGALVWIGWMVWAGVLLLLGATRNLEVPERPRLTGRAKLLAALGLVVLALTFMPEPIQQESVPLDEPAVPAADEVQAG